MARARELMPEQLTLPALATAAARCRACPLFERGTQTVFGDGPLGAPLMLVGEQPGNEEDLQGRAFVGPAGKLLDRALAEAGIAREQAYVTNVVKHFKWEPRGKRRIHQKPNAVEIVACLPWLETEIAVVRPKILVCLGATAAQAMIGRSFRVSIQHGDFVETRYAELTTATLHPSSILRAQTDADRARQFDGFVTDLKKIARAMT
jgi:uracil-DNA glycosylase